MHWLSNNLTKEPQEKRNEGGRESGEEDGERGSDLSLPTCARSPPDMRPTLDSYFNVLSVGDEKNPSAIAKISKRSLDSGSSSEQDDDMFLKKVSFAKHSQRYPAMGVGNLEKISESDLNCAYFEKVPEGKPESDKPWLQTRPYSSPPPPRSISPTPIMKSRQTPPKQNSTDYSLDWDENWPGSLVENYQDHNDLLYSPSSVSPILSNRSLVSGSESLKLVSNTHIGVETHSNELDSITASITTDYYSPLGFFYEGTFSRKSSWEEATITRSASAPSFMICATEEGQLSHCLTDDSNIDDFKKYLLNLSDFSGTPANCSIKVDENEEIPGVIDTYSSSFKSLNKSNFSLVKCRTVSRATQTSTSDDEIISPYYAESEETEMEMPVKCGYRDIALSELLDRIYPSVYKSSEGSMSPSPQNQNQIKSSEDSITPSPLQQSYYKSSEDSMPPSPLNHHNHFKPSNNSISSSPDYPSHLKSSTDSSISTSPLYHHQYQFKSQEDGTSPGLTHHSHFKFAGLVIRNNHNLELPVISNQQNPCSTAEESNTIKSTHSIQSAGPLQDLEESLDVSSVYSATNMPSTLMFHRSDRESGDSENQSKRSSSNNSDTSLGHTYSVHGSDNSSFTIPSLPLDCIQSSPHTASISAASTPASAVGNTSLEENSEKESRDTSSELPSTAGSNDDNYDSAFNPKQGSSSDYYSECLSQPNTSLINDSADMSMMTIPNLPLGGFGTRSSGDGTSLNTTSDSVAVVLPSPLKEQEDDEVKSVESFNLQAASAPTFTLPTENSSKESADSPRKATVVPASVISEESESPRSVSQMDAQDNAQKRKT